MLSCVESAYAVSLDGKLATDLHHKWNAIHLAEIPRCVVNFRVVRLGGGEYVSRRPREMVNNILAKSRFLEGDEQGLNAIALATVKPKHAARLQWESARIARDNKKRRYDSTCGEQPAFEYVFDGHQVITARPMRHGKQAWVKYVDIATPGASRTDFVGLENLQFIPPIPVVDKEMEWDSVTEREDGRLELVGSEIELVVERSTGIVRRWLEMQRSMPLQEVFQEGTIDAPGGISLPMFVAAFGYREGQLDSLRLTIVDDIRLNTPVPEDTFSVTAPARSRILDKRSPGGATVYSLQQDQVDVVAFVAKQMNANDGLDGGRRD